MSKAQELAYKLDGFLDSDANEAAAELRRLDRVNAELMQAMERAAMYLTDNKPRSKSTDIQAAYNLRAALSSSGGNES